MSNRDIEQATKALERLSEDPKAQELARWREDQLRLYRMELATLAQRERKEGLEEGLEKGHLEGLREGRLEGQREGRLEGQREGQQRTVHQLCSAFGIDVGPDRAAALASMSSAELSALVDYLALRRQWPEQ